MANTLEAKTPEQLSAALRSYNSHMCEIPAHFTVLDEYLHGITVPEFCSAFKVLQKIVIDLYAHISAEPQVIGLLEKDRKTGEWKVHSSQQISCIKKLLYVIGRFSTLDGSTLHIQTKTLMDAYMTYYHNSSVELAEQVKEFDDLKHKKFFETKHMRAVLTCLQQFGFHIDGLTEDDMTTLNICYPEQPAVLIALKAFAMPKICRISFGFDFTKFNYRVFAYPSDAKLPLEDLYSYSLLSDEHKRFLSALDRAMAEQNADYGECESGWYHGELPCQYIYRNKVRIMQNIEHGLIPFVVVRFGKKIDKVTRFIETLPPEYHAGIGRCSGCRKGECDHRFPGTAAGEKYVLCNVAWWGFPPLTDAIPYIVGAYKI